MAVIEKRRTQEGAISFRAKVRIKGFPPQTQTFNRLTDARLWAQKTEAAIRDGRLQPAQESKAHTLGELIDRYIETRLLQKSESTQEAQHRHLLWWKKQLGAHSLDRITPAILIEYREKLQSEVVRGGIKRSYSTCNRFMAALAHALTIAWKEWEWLEQNPIRRISKFREPEGRVRYLDDDEQRRLLEECKKSTSCHLYLIVLIAISTGMRLNEIKTLTWKQIDLRKGTIVIYKTKNKRPRQVPLKGSALRELEIHSKVRRIDSDLLFPGPLKTKSPVNMRSAWQRARDRAGLKDFRFHDLRHTAASYFAMSGASARDLCDIFGWKTMQMAMRYAHLSETHTAKIAEKMNDTFILSTNVR